MPNFRDAVRLRTRYIDDFVNARAREGFDQLVLLGAGFDTRGLRMREVVERGVRVFEVDIADQLARKRSVLAGAGVALPPHVAYVPFDFNTRDLATHLTAALVAKGFRAGVGAAFVMEGVIGYIDDAAIDATLRFMATAGGPRTRVVMTYADPSFDTSAERLPRNGFAFDEELAGDALHRRYLPGEPHPFAHVVRIGTARVVA
jgi:methyltransferase (TIGR00027 family)